MALFISGNILLDIRIFYDSKDDTILCTYLDNCAILAF